MTAGTGQPPVPWWSFTKTLLATAALLLVAQGRLTLDGPLANRPYSLRQLLQHRAGVPDYCAMAAYQHAARRGDPPWSVEELLHRASAERLLFNPGQGWRYSNIGYLFVRRSIEQCTGQDIGDALQSLIFGPLGLPSARLASTAADLERTAWGNGAKYHPGWVYHGLLIGTPAEAARFLHLLITGGVLPAALRGEMLNRHPIGGSIPGRLWQDHGYGLGLMMGRMHGAGTATGHSGAGPGSNAAVYHFPGAAPPCTIAIFAQTEDEGQAEFEAARLAASI